jgi:hypothetical protein
MKLLGFLLIWALAIPAVRGARWAYIAFVVLGLLYLPASTGFSVDPKRCDLTLDLRLAVQSLSNFPHIVLFFLFFLITTRQFRLSRWPLLGWSIGLTMAMGAGVEIAEGLSGEHHCKAVDLIPDFIGAVLGVMVLVLIGILARTNVTNHNGGNGAIGESRAID